MENILTRDHINCRNKHKQLCFIDRHAGRVPTSSGKQGKNYGQGKVKELF
jgi:hypothetical protein